MDRKKRAAVLLIITLAAAYYYLGVPMVFRKITQSQRDIERRLINDLRNDFLFNPAQVAGIVGNLAHESGGFRFFQEINPTEPGSRGGWGYAQWTASRRKNFESWARKRLLDFRSYEANYGFLKHELKNTHNGKNLLPSYRKITTPTAAALKFSKVFLRPGIPHITSRITEAKRVYSAITGGSV